jgi:hypothetical protein
MHTQLRDGVAMTCVGDTVITVWNRAVTADNWAWHTEALRAAAEKHARGVLVLNVIRTTSPMPNAAMRRQMEQDYLALGDQVRHMVAIAVGSTMWITLVRAMLRTMAQLIGRSDRLSMTGTVDEALIAAEPFATARTPPNGELRNIIDALHQRLGLPPPSAQR